MYIVHIYRMYLSLLFRAKNALSTTGYNAKGIRRMKKTDFPLGQQICLLNLFFLFLQTMFPDIEDAEINSRLVGYCSDQVKTKQKFAISVNWRCSDFFNFF